MRIVGIGVAVSLASLACAQSAPPIDAELRARFGLTGPLIHKIGWGIGLLRVEALDDGRPAVAIVNNGRRARLEILRCDGDQLVATTESTDGEVAGLAVADVDGDGRRDFVMLTGRGRLVTRLRSDPPRSLPEIDVGTAGGRDAIRAGDLDGDGRADVLVSTTDGLRCVTDLTGTPRVSAADPVVAQDIDSLHLFDADGDRRLDVVIDTSDDNMGIAIKRGRGDGTFGPWIQLPVRDLRSVFPGTGTVDRPTLATVEGGHHRVVEYRLERVTDATRPPVEVTSLPPDKRRRPRPVAQGDVDGDGNADLVLADPERAQLILLLERAGGFALETVPSLSGIDSVAIDDIDGDGKADLLIASGEERAIAWKSGARPLTAFPERLPSREQPMCVAHHDGSLWYVAQDDRRQAKLFRSERGTDGSWSDAAEIADLGRMAEGPLRLWVANLDGQHGPDLAFVQPGKGLRVLLAQADGKYRPATGKDDALFDIEEGAVSLLEHDGEPALLTTRGRYARTLRFDAGGEPIVLAQSNGPEGIEEMSLGCRLDAARRVWIDNKAAKAWIESDGAAVSVDIPRLGATHVLAGNGAVLLVAKTGVARIPIGRSSWTLNRLRVHEPPTEKTDYYRGIATDLDADGRADLAVADAHIHGFHVLVADDDRLSRALSFPVFELPETGRGGYEPRDFATGDLNGDGADDLVVLCHDRVLVYLQEK